MDFPKKQAQRLMPLYLLEYSEKLFTNHPNPEDPWGGGSDYTAGQGITITNNEISVDTNVIATKSDIPSLDGYATETWVQNQGYATSSEIPTNYVTTDTEQTITGLKTIGETSGTISEVDFSGFTFKLSNKAINHPEADIKIRNASYDGYQYPTIYSTKGLYVNLAKIKLGDDGNNTYGIKMPDSSTWEADRVLATTDDIPSLDGYAEIVDVTNGFPDETKTAEILANPSKYILHGIVTINNFEYHVFGSYAGYIASNGNTWMQIIRIPAGSGYTGYTLQPYAFCYNTGGKWTGPLKFLWKISYGNIYNTPTLATVATSGSYNDLTDKPNLLPIMNATESFTFIATESHMPPYKWGENMACTSTWICYGSVEALPQIYLQHWFGIDECYAYPQYMWQDSSGYHAVYSTELVQDNAGASGGRIVLNAPSIGDTWTSVSTYPIYSEIYTAGNGIDITNNQISIDNTVALKSEVPSTATSTSTSTVTPSTIELVFTYQDNTTQTITLMTGATVSTSTTTTLS